MKKQHIAIISYGEFYPFLGGIALYTGAIIDALHHAYDITVLTHRQKKAIHFPIKDINIYEIPVTRFSLVKYVIGNISTLLHVWLQKPTLVIITHPESLWLSQWLIRLNSIKGSKRPKIIVLLHGTEIMDASQNAGMISAKKFTASMRYVDLILTDSEYTQNLLHRYFPEIATKDMVLHPTVWEEAFSDSENLEKNISKNPLTTYGLKKHSYVISIGRLVKRKGHHLIIKQLMELLKHDPHFKYVIVGSGPEKESLISLSQKYGNDVENALVICTDLDEDSKNILLKNALCYAQPSIPSDEYGQRVEGFGIAILEGLKSGLPAIVSNHGGMKEIITNGENGFVFDAEKDTQSIARLIIRLIKNDDLRERMQKNALVTYREVFSPHIFNDKLLAILNNLANKKTVLFVIEWFYPVLGGAGNQALRLARALKKEYDIFFVTKLPAQGKRVTKAEKVEGFPVFRFGSGRNSKFNDYASAFSLWLFLMFKSRSFDLVHVHGNVENNFASAAIFSSLILRKPIIGKLAVSGELLKHTEASQSPFVSFIKNMNPLNQWRRYLAKLLTHYIAISNDIYEEIVAVGISASKISKIPNGIVVDEYSVATDDEKYNARQMLGLSKNAVICLVVSRLARHKGLMHPLLSTWKNFYQNEKDLQLVIVGSGEGLSSSIEEEVATYVKAHHMNNVLLVGRRSDLRPYYHAADVFILPSENEGLSNALLEAGASGLIPVVSAVSGSTDVVKSSVEHSDSENKNGYVYGDSGNGYRYASLGEALNAALSEEEYWPQMRERIRHTITTSYDMKKIARSIDHLYKTILL